MNDPTTRDHKAELGAIAVLLTGIDCDTEASPEERREARALLEVMGLPTEPAEPETVDEIRVRRLVVVDDDGAERIRLEVLSDGAQVMVTGKNSEWVAITAGADGAEVGERSAEIIVCHDEIGGNGDTAVLNVFGLEVTPAST